MTGRSGGSDAAISIEGTDMLVQSNTVLRSAHIGIRFSNQAGNRIIDNAVVSACSRLTDCGGIYTWTGPDKAPAAASSDRAGLVQGNFVVGGKANLEGTAGRGTNRGVGIYLDEGSKSISVVGNRIAGPELGVFLHNAANNDIRGNWIWAVGHAAFSAHQSRGDMEVLRGNHVAGNHLQGQAFGAQTARLNPAAFALEWHHPRDAQGFLIGDNPNTIDGNEVFTSAPDGTVWSMRTDVKPAETLTSPQWRTWAQSDVVHVLPAGLNDSSTNGVLVMNASATPLQLACSDLGGLSCTAIDETGATVRWPLVIEAGQSQLLFSKTR
jgi:parallel beta-helix repeat protein